MKGSHGEGLVFVIDDDESVRKSIESLIRSARLKAKAFASAEEFLRIKRSDIPACVVLDVRLPGMSGLDLQMRMAQSGIKIPIIFITGDGDIRMGVHAMKAGAVEFLTKPFSDQDLIEAVQQGIERDRLSRQGPLQCTDESSGHQATQEELNRWQVKFMMAWRNILVRSICGWPSPGKYYLQQEVNRSAASIKRLN